MGSVAIQAGRHAFADSSQTQYTDNPHSESMGQTVHGVLFSAGLHAFGVRIDFFSIPQVIPKKACHPRRHVPPTWDGCGTDLTLRSLMPCDTLKLVNRPYDGRRSAASIACAEAGYDS